MSRRRDLWYLRRWPSDRWFRARQVCVVVYYGQKIVEPAPVFPGSGQSRKAQRHLRRTSCGIPAPAWRDAKRRRSLGQHAVRVAGLLRRNLLMRVYGQAPSLTSSYERQPLSHRRAPARSDSERLDADASQFRSSWPSRCARALGDLRALASSHPLWHQYAPPYSRACPSRQILQSLALSSLPAVPCWTALRPRPAATSSRLLRRQDAIELVGSVQMSLNAAVLTSRHSDWRSDVVHFGHNARLHNDLRLRHRSRCIAQPRDRLSVIVPRAPVARPRVRCFRSRWPTRSDRNCLPPKNRSPIGFPRDAAG